jgi:hypothetical protein
MGETHSLSDQAIGFGSALGTGSKLWNRIGETHELSDQAIGLTLVVNFYGGNDLRII